MSEQYPYVDFEGVKEAAYGMTVPSAAQPSVERLIAKAGERLAARVPRIQERVRDGSLSKELVAGVIEDMVIRVIRNPYGYASEQAGEFMYRIDRAVASGAVQVNQSEVDLLMDAASAGSGFGRISMSLPPWRIP